MNHIIGTPLRWTVLLFDETGEPVDADALPSVSLRINQATTAQTVNTPIKRSDSTGIYDVSASLSGISEGDHIEALVKIEIGGVEYQTAYQWTAVEPLSATRILANIAAKNTQR